MEEKKKNLKTIKMLEKEYLMFRRDQQAKREIKRMVLEIFDKVKKWK